MSHYLTLHWRENACPVEPQTGIRPEFHPSPITASDPVLAPFPSPRALSHARYKLGNKCCENLGCTGEKILDGVRRPGWVSALPLTSGVAEPPTAAGRSAPKAARAPKEKALLPADR